MNAAHIAKLMTIAQLAMDLCKARNDTVSAKYAYYAALHEFQSDQMEPADHLDPRDENCAEIIAYSADAYKAYLAAKRKVYNAQRRLDTACRKVAA